MRERSIFKLSQEKEIDCLRKEMEVDQFHLRYEWVAGLMQANIQNISRERQKNIERLSKAFKVG